MGRTVDVLVAEGEGRKDDATGRLSGRAADNRLVHFAVGDVVPRPGDMAGVQVTYAAPHHLVADGPVCSVRPTAAGDAWERRQSDSGCGPVAGAGIAARWGRCPGTADRRRDSGALTVLVAAAFLPHPPVLVPEVASGAALELAALREACAVALERVLSAQPTLVIVVGDASERSTYSAGTGGSFAGFGVPVATALPGSDGDGVVGGVVRGEARLPLSLAIGAWLMERSGPWPAVRGEGVPATMASPDAASLGEQWAASSERVALIVMGDGATTLTVKAPGYLGTAQRNGNGRSRSRWSMQTWPH